MQKSLDGCGWGDSLIAPLASPDLPTAQTPSPRNGIEDSQLPHLKLKREVMAETGGPRGIVVAPWAAIAAVVARCCRAAKPKECVVRAQLLVVAWPFNRRRPSRFFRWTATWRDVRM